MTSAVVPGGSIWTAGVNDLLLPALATAAAVIVLARLAPALGLYDRGGGLGLHRESDAQGRCLVGGLALGIGLAVSAELPWGERAVFPREFGALFLALLVGLLDDRSTAGLAARDKLLLQILPASALALCLPGLGPWLVALYLAAAIAAQNLANTYDNADGVLLLSAALALAPGRPAASAIAFTVLAFNLRRRSPAAVILGDSGSHLIAILLLCEPRAWGAFVLPALDLARVVVVRRQQGRAWWIGDRVHLAHRLAARGMGRASVAMTLALAALPAILAGGFAHGIVPWSLGLVASATVFALLVRITPAVDGCGVEISGARSGMRPAGADLDP